MEIEQSQKEIESKFDLNYKGDGILKEIDPCINQEEEISYLSNKVELLIFIICLIFLLIEIFFVSLLI